VEIRIETSDAALYQKLHPRNKMHDFKERLKALERLRAAGYQVGSGVMIGLPFQTIENMAELPFQTIENMAEDLLFLKNIDIDMVGMGPFIEHKDTPLYQYKEELSSLQERFELSLNMVALLRMLMPTINIAATTAMQAIDPQLATK